MRRRLRSGAESTRDATMGKGKGKGSSTVVAAFGWGHSNTVITERSHGERVGNSLVRARSLSPLVLCLQHSSARHRAARAPASSS